MFPSAGISRSTSECQDALDPRLLINDGWQTAAPRGVRFRFSLSIDAVRPFRFPQCSDFELGSEQNLTKSERRRRLPFLGMPPLSSSRGPRSGRCSGHRLSTAASMSKNKGAGPITGPAP